MRTGPPRIPVAANGDVPTQFTIRARAARRLRSHIVPKTSLGRAAQVPIAVALAIAPLFIAFPIVALAKARPAMVDLAVFRDAGLTVLRGQPLFASAFGHTLREPLPFTYPPFAALCFVALAVLPLPADSIVWWVLCLLALGIAIAVSFRPLLARAGDAWPLVGGVLMGLFFITDPIRSVMSFGQLGLGLMALVLLDCLALRPRWPRGMLVGFATAIKLVPGLFILYFLVTHRFREAKIATASFLGATALSFAVLPSAATQYWTHLVFDANRVGSPAYYSNQSLLGVIERVGVSKAGTVCWVLLCALALALAYFGAVRAHRRGDEVAALAIVGLTSSLVSPISWIHHLVWLVPAAAVLLGDLRSIRRAILALGVIAFFSLHMPELGHELVKKSGPTPFRLVLEDFFTIGDVALLLLLAFVHKPAPKEPTVADLSEASARL